MAGPDERASTSGAGESPTPARPPSAPWDQGRAEVTSCGTDDGNRPGSPSPRSPASDIERGTHTDAETRRARLFGRADEVRHFSTAAELEALLPERDREAKVAGRFAGRPVAPRRDREYREGFPRDAAPEPDTERGSLAWWLRLARIVEPTILWPVSIGPTLRLDVITAVLRHANRSGLVAVTPVAVHRLTERDQ